MADRRGLLTYLALFMAAAMSAGMVYRLADWGHDVLGCAVNRERGTFLAYCTSEQYGDYEHGAYYFDLEPEAVENLRNAKVLFLGNSRNQFVFSTDEVKRYFEERSIPFYVMGFGYDELNEFARELIEKYSLRPKVLIIVSDPFFSSGLSLPASQIAGDFGARWQPYLGQFRVFRHLRQVRTFMDYVTKKIFNTLHPIICNLHAQLCVSHSPTIYRSASDGSWIWRNIFAPAEYGQLPIDPARQAALPKESATADQENAKRLFAAARVPRDCIVLTVVPNSKIDAEPYALEMGRLLGVRVELPKLNGLATIDHSHLTWTSAQRWSGTLLRKIDTQIARCVSGY
jgi:hypothetical protein